jgi:hypothetical protein
MKMRWRSSGASACLLTTALVLAAGCQSLEHVRSLRDAQDAFTRTTLRSNRLALSQVLPADPGATGEGPAWTAGSGLETGLDPDECARTAAEYAFVARSLAALNERMSSHLQADRLLGLSLTARTAIPRNRRPCSPSGRGETPC